MLIYFIGPIILILIKIINVIFTKKCESKTRLDGKTVLITGCTTGIGRETTYDMARRGARVIMACRDISLAKKIIADIEKKTGNRNLVVHKLELESLESIREFSKKIHETESRLDILINNAGAGGLGNRKTRDGLDATMQVNHFGPFLLTNLLVDLLKKSAPSRIVNVASRAYIFAYLDLNNLNKFKTFLSIDFINYSNSKLCNILMSNELANRLSNSGVTSNSLHPGSVKTELFKHMRAIFRYPTQIFSYFTLLTPEQGAQTTIYLAVSEEVEGVTGKYFDNCTEHKVRSRYVNDSRVATKVWELSEKFVELKPEEQHC